MHLQRSSIEGQPKEKRRETMMSDFRSDAYVFNERYHEHEPRQYPNYDDEQVATEPPSTLTKESELG